MSMESAKKFAEKFYRTPSLADQLSIISDDEKILTVARDNGFDGTLEELKLAFKEIMKELIAEGTPGNVLCEIFCDDAWILHLKGIKRKSLYTFFL